MVMPLKLKNAWVKALNSGEYLQGSGYLKRAPRKQKAMFCCLGVLCDVAGEKSVKSPHVSNGVYSYDGMWGMLSDKYMNKFGLTKNQQDKLAMMNDGGKPFSYIASWIKKNVKSK